MHGTAYIALYYFIGIVGVVIGWRGVKKNPDDGPAVFFLGFGLLMLYWAAIWTFNLQSQMGI